MEIVINVIEVVFIYIYMQYIYIIVTDKVHVIIVIEFAHITKISTHPSPRQGWVAPAFVADPLL